ncbi:MAG: TetR/AcrR family transcriptional regulator [Actinobacteria bacterium]|nr:TetR/AcrR family transcriptional regulator [Actinomycetota bacterium]
MATDTAPRAPLSPAAIVAAGITLADEQGVDALSMRNLARSLGYEVMSLYNHVRNKDDLLTLMVDAVAAEIDLPDPSAPPLVAVRAMAVSTNAALARHPWAAPLWLRQAPGPARMRQMDDLLRLMYASGLSRELAHHGFHAVNNHVLGYTLQRLGMGLEGTDLEDKARDFMAGLDADTYPFMVAHIHEHLDGHTGSSFELVLDLILDGLVRLDREAR